MNKHVCRCGGTFCDPCKGICDGPRPWSCTTGKSRSVTLESNIKRCSIVFYIHFVLQSFNVVFNLYVCFSSSLQKISFVSFRQSRIMVTPIIFVYSELEVFATQIRQVIAQQTIAAKMEFASQIKFVGTLQVIILIYIPISVFYTERHKMEQHKFTEIHLRWKLFVLVKIISEIESDVCDPKEVSIAYGKNPVTGQLICSCTCDGSDPGKGLVNIVAGSKDQIANLKPTNHTVTVRPDGKAAINK